MSDDKTAATVFDELASQNPQVARALRNIRMRAESAMRGEAREHRMPAGTPGIVLTHTHRASLGMGLATARECPEIRPTLIVRRRIWPLVIALVLLAVGVIALGMVFGAAVVRFIQQFWKPIVLPAAGICLGAGAVLLASRIGKAPLKAVSPPSQEADNQLKELEALAVRTASRLRSTYVFQLWTVIVVGTIFAALIIWSMVLVSQKQVLYASTFGSGGVAMVILTQWKWQPFDRINTARRLADNADTLATGLRLRMRTIKEITDPRERAKAQWDAVAAYLDRS